tara:strand:+ start:1107 stop:1802 length:696 start_codon:yes stop_codon:yes gene_type:complete
MWLNKEHVLDEAISAYRHALRQASPRHLVIDNLFSSAKLDEVLGILRLEQNWQTQKHSYSALYVDEAKWQKTRQPQRFVQRDLWQRPALTAADPAADIALQFLQYLRGAEFMALLSRLFKVQLTDVNVAKPEVNTNYFRLGASDFVNQHADDSPGREVCMLLYLNTDWQPNNGGELVFMGNNDAPITIAPQHNRCVLFDPASPGAEHWVKPLTEAAPGAYRYNVTSWYWSE